MFKDAITFLESLNRKFLLFVLLYATREINQSQELQLSYGENKGCNDAEGRKTLHSIVGSICIKGIHVILITSPAELPACITHVAVLEKGALISAQKKHNYLQRPGIIKTAIELNTILLRQLQQPAETDFTTAVKMDEVTTLWRKNYSQ